MLDRQRVLWIGANASGNRRSPPDRIHLALDAAEHLLRLMPPGAGVYVGGFSGGARIASEAALLDPDLFVGGLFVGAADYFRWIRSSNPRWSGWEPTFPPPPAELLQWARTRGRYVLLTGSRDSNRDLVRDVHRAYLVDGIRTAVLIEVPELEHELPSARGFEDALVALLSAMPSRPRQPTGRCR